VVETGIVISLLIKEPSSVFIAGFCTELLPVSNLKFAASTETLAVGISPTEASTE